MNLRRVVMPKPKFTKNNIRSSVITNITDRAETQKTLFKLGCVWNGGAPDLVYETFTHILISPIGRMSFFYENGDSNGTFEHYFRNDPRLYQYKMIKASKL